MAFGESYIWYAMRYILSAGEIYAKDKSPNGINMSRIAVVIAICNGYV